MTTIESYYILISNFLKEHDPDEGFRENLFLDPSISNDSAHWLSSRKLFWRFKRSTSAEYTTYDSNYQKRRRLNQSKPYGLIDDEDPEEGQRISYFLDSQIYQTVSWIIARKCLWKVKWGHGLKTRSGYTEPDASYHQFTIWLHDAKTRWKNNRIAIKERNNRWNSDKRPKCPKDIMPLFDARLGLPDDIVAYTLSFLPCNEHIRLLHVNKTTSKLIRAREDMWRALCPTHWTLPKRPRKSWCDIYLDGLIKYEEVRNKRSDDLLVKAAEILMKGDYLQTLDKIVRDGERSCGFNVNYTSGTVEERNSLLNLAVINGRHKCARWLIEVKSADIQSFDRGLFTPLHNAAYNGDILMVRYLLRKGADRTKVAKFHSSTGVTLNALGLTAEQWARKRGHHSIADLIQNGI